MNNPTTVKVTKVDIKKRKDLVPLDFPVVQELFDVVAKCGDNDKYCFEAVFPFGTKILDNNNPSLIHDDQFSIEWKDEVGNLSSEKVREQFRSSCGRNSDHPLSIVVKGEVEVYSWRDVNITDGKYPLSCTNYFPLNDLGKGGWFGVYGTADLIAQEANVELNRWSGVRHWGVMAGSRCISLAIPPPAAGKVSVDYRKGFAHVFQGLPEEYETTMLEEQATLSADERTLVLGQFEQVTYDSFRDMVNAELGDEAATHVLVIPEHFFLIDAKNDSRPLKAAKTALQRQLLIYGWGQSATERDSRWRQRGLALNSKLDTVTARTAFIHFMDVLKGKGYCMRTVREGDGVLYKGWRVLCDRWTQHGMWKHAAPLLLTYDSEIPEDGTSALVFSRFLPANVIVYGATDSRSMKSKKGALLQAIKKEASGHDVICEYESKGHKMIEGLLKEEIRLRGEVVLGTEHDRSGKETSVTMGNARIKKGTKSKFLPAYFDHTYTFRKKSHV